jgi:hypothetical protein
MPWAFPPDEDQITGKVDAVRTYFSGHTQIHLTGGKMSERCKRENVNTNGWMLVFGTAGTITDLALVSFIHNKKIRVFTRVSNALQSPNCEILRAEVFQ